MEQTNYSNQFSNNPNYGVPPQNYMTLAIISTILGCCSFFGLGFIAGLVAIYFASQVNPRFNAGDLAGAEKNSRNAKMLAFIAIGLMVVGLLYTAYTYYANPEIWEQSMEQSREIMEQWGIEQPE